MYICFDLSSSRFTHDNRHEAIFNNHTVQAFFTYARLSLDNEFHEPVQIKADEYLRSYSKTYKHSIIIKFNSPFLYYCWIAAT
jgi:hypothetical protein